MKCNSCNTLISPDENFCPGCGISIKDQKLTSQTDPQGPKTISSAGAYSGTMIKSKSKFWKRLKNSIIGFILAIVIALIVWFQVDPDAGKKLTNILVGLGLMAVFAFFIYRKAKKGKGRRRGGSFRRGNRSDDDRDDDQYDDDDDDGGDDD